MAILDTVFQSIILSVVSNILAQVISNYQSNKTLYTIDPLPIGHFIIYTIVNVPINVIWQNWLEDTFPGSKPAPLPAGAKQVIDEKKKNKNPEKEKSVRDVKNVVIKFLADQTIGAAMNIPLFLVTIGLVKGQSLSHIVDEIRADGFNIYLAGMKLWPAVSAISFAAIPVEKRVIFGSLAGVAWNIYLSLRAAK